MFDVVSSSSDRDKHCGLLSEIDCVVVSSSDCNDASVAILRVINAL